MIAQRTIFLLKSHIDTYTKRDGTVVGAHETKVQKKNAEEKLKSPPVTRYRVQRTAANAVNLLPPIGKRFTDGEVAGLRSWLSSAGFHVSSRGGAIHAIGDGAPNIPDGLKQQKAARASESAQKRAGEKASRESTKEEEYRSLSSSQWIEETLGSDFANLHNKLALAWFLDGRDSFNGLVSRSWLEPLMSLGFDASRDGVTLDEMLSFLKGKYKESAGNANGNLLKTYVAAYIHNADSMLKAMPGEFSGGEQKDWIVYSQDMTRLFCIAIVNDGGGWYLWETVNLFGKSVKEIRDKISMGYHTMFQAMVGRDRYSYVIAHHRFDKKAIDTPFWRGLIPADGFWGMATLPKGKVKIDKDEFEREMKRLVPGVSFEGRK